MMKPSLANTIQKWAFTLLSALAVILIAANTVTIVRESESRSARLREQYIQKQHQIIKFEAESLARLIDQEREKRFHGAKTTVEARVASAHAMAKNLYEQYIGSRTEEEIQKIAIDALSPIRMDKEGGYYFVIDFNGSVKLAPCSGGHEGTALSERHNASRKRLVTEMVRLAKSSGEGFYAYHWTKPGCRGDHFEKIAFVKAFAPFNWVIGTGIYLNDLESDMQEIISQYVNSHRFGPGGKGSFIVYELLGREGKADGATVYARPDFSGETGEQGPDDKMDAGEKPFRKGILKDLREKGACYADDWSGEIDDPRMSFFRLAGKGRFIVAASVDMDDVEGQILLTQKDIDRQVWRGFFTIVTVFLAALLIVMMLVNRLKKRLDNDFQIFTDGFNLAATHSQLIDREGVRFSELDRMAGVANRMLSQKADAEQDRKEIQERLTQAQKTARVGHYILDLKKERWVYSEEVRHIFEVEEESRQGISGWLKIVHPDFRVSMSAYLEDQVFSRHRKFDREYKIIAKKTGREKWVHGLGALKLDEAGTPVEMFGTIQDVTERKLMEESLRLSQFIFDKAAVGIFQVSSEGRIITVNEKAGDTLGYTVDELSAMTVFDINPSLTPEKFKSVWQILVKKGYEDFETVHRHRDGRLFSVEIISNRIEFNGETFSISFVQDISGRKAAEERRRELESQLRQARKMEAIGTLAGGIAHDFNNILSGMVGYAQLAAAHIHAPEKAARHIEQIVKGARRATDLTKQILTFSRQSEYEKTPFRMVYEVKETLKLIRSSIPATIDIEARLDSNKTVLADPIKIHQVIMNLCTNAYQAMRKTGGVLTVALADVRFSIPRGEGDKKVPPGDYLRLEISDTGQGMDEKTLEKAFEPYFTTKEKSEGTGLGLALVQAIVEEHDGLLRVYSEVGKGTRFSLFFPIVEDPSGPDCPEKIPQPPLSGSESIMVVDDEAQIRDICREFLGSLGYRVRTFKNGSEALAAFKAAPQAVDFVLTDMTMPGLTGDKLAAKMMKIRPDIPVVLCTGFSEAITREKAMAIGIKHYLQKPIFNEDLAALIRRILDQKEGLPFGGETDIPLNAFRDKP